MKAFGILTVSTPICSYASTMHVSRTDLVPTDGELASSLDRDSLCFLPLATDLPFRAPSILSLRKRWYSRIVFLCSYVFRSGTYFIYRLTCPSYGAASYMIGLLL